MTEDRPYRGILLMLGFCVAAPFADAVAKLIGSAVSMPVLLLARFGLQAALLLPLVIALRLRLSLPRRLILLTGIRTVLHMAGIPCMFLALRYLPLADAIAIAFVMPFIMLLLGHFVLAEQVGPRRLAACAVGFAGTLMVIQPSFATVGAPALLPLAVAVIFALFVLITRQVAKDIDPVALQALNGLMALPLLLPAALLAWRSGDPGTAPALFTAEIWGLLGVLGVLGTAAHLMMTWSLRYAPASTLAPMQYLEIPVATLVGLAIFGDFPNGLALLGILVTTSAGLYIILRERRASRLDPATAPPPPS